MNIKVVVQKFIYGSGIVYVLVRDLCVVIILGVILNYFVFSIYPVLGESMKPSLETGNLVFINKINAHRNLKRGQVVILKFPADKESKLLVKRIIGLPGERITLTSIGVQINGSKLTESYLADQSKNGIADSITIDKTLAYDEYYVMGDNRINSSDSRTFGPIQADDILGKAQIIIWPGNQFKFLALPTY